jgi:nicotinate dehydrogenase subunit B
MSGSNNPSLAQNPQLDRWIAFLPGERVRIATGKVEIGQGILTALAQIAADELDIPLSQVDILSGSSAHGPDERYTTSSLSIQESGAAIRAVCAEVRARMLTRVAQRLNCAVDEIEVENGAFLHAQEPTGFTYWKLAPDVDLRSPVSGAALPKSADRYRVVGQSVPRTDLPAKVTGAAFIHDLERADLVHARTLRQPCRGARLASFDEAHARRAAGAPIDIVRVGDFVAFLSTTEAAAERAAVSANDSAQWRELTLIEPQADEAAWLLDQPAVTRRIGAAPRSDPQLDPQSDSGTDIELNPESGPTSASVPHPPAYVPMADVPSRRFQAMFSRGYVAHASMGPSCALAEYRDGHLHVWSHGQGMHPLRRTLADALGLAVEDITTEHVQGPGCYGHNGADDAALDAAIVALQRPDKCIRVQWRREEEFAFEPVGPSMQVQLQVVLDEQGRPQDWTSEIWSGVHVQRPGLGGGNLLATEALPQPAGAPDVSDPPEERGGGATRNAVPLYDVGAHRIVHHLVPALPVRTSALRGLGALPNVFAIESVMDELAQRAGEDPLVYRLALISDPRTREILKQVACRAQWNLRSPGGHGKGLGMAVARYKNTAAYAAVIAAVTVDETVQVNKVWCVADAGLVINPDGARNQLEGGIVQAMSWTLKEQVRFDEHGISSVDWDRYPIVRFSEIPEIDVQLIGRSTHLSPHPSLGVGECSVGPTAAAIGNALAHALGRRIHDLPMTRDRIVSSLLN